MGPQGFQPSRQKCQLTTIEYEREERKEGRKRELRIKLPIDVISSVIVNQCMSKHGKVLSLSFLLSSSFLSLSPLKLITPTLLTLTGVSQLMHGLALVTKASTALAWISSKPHQHISHFRHQTFRRQTLATITDMPSTNERQGLNLNYVDAGANLLDSMYQGTYHGKDV